MQRFKSNEIYQEGRHRDGRILSLVEIPIGDLKKVRRRKRIEKYKNWNEINWVEEKKKIKGTNNSIFFFSGFQMAGGQDPKWQKDAADQNFDYMFKLLIIGNSSVGKTSFLFRYADDSFTSAFVSTVGIDFKVKTVFRHDKRVKLQIWVGSN